ncbi:MAG TPA: hypothetical protein VG123_00635 [Streptosporangiaceae bacterium]|nr:hypothetical protein [Streptosporangiaceae bacterium]
MAGSAADAMLSAAEARAAEALLANAWGEPVEVRAAAAIWERRHVLRLSLDSGRTAVLPRLRATAEAMRDRLAARWQGLRMPDYPALARAGSVLARAPDGWQPVL